MVFAVCGRPLPYFHLRYLSQVITFSLMLVDVKKYDRKPDCGLIVEYKMLLT